MSKAANYLLRDEDGMVRSTVGSNFHGSIDARAFSYPITSYLTMAPLSHFEMSLPLEVLYETRIGETEQERRRIHAQIERMVCSNYCGTYPGRNVIGKAFSALYLKEDEEEVKELCSSMIADRNFNLERVGQEHVPEMSFWSPNFIPASITAMVEYKDEKAESGWKMLEHAELANNHNDAFGIRVKPRIRLTQRDVDLYDFACKGTASFFPHYVDVKRFVIVHPDDEQFMVDKHITCNGAVNKGCGICRTPFKSMERHIKRGNLKKAIMLGRSSTRVTLLVMDPDTLAEYLSTGLLLKDEIMCSRAYHDIKNFKKLAKYSDPMNRIPCPSRNNAINSAGGYDMNSVVVNRSIVSIIDGTAPGYYKYPVPITEIVSDFHGDAYTLSTVWYPAIPPTQSEFVAEQLSWNWQRVMKGIDGMRLYIYDIHLLYAHNTVVTFDASGLAHRVENVGPFKDVILTTHFMRLIAQGLIQLAEICNTKSNKACFLAPFPLGWDPVKAMVPETFHGDQRKVSMIGTEIASYILSLSILMTYFRDEETTEPRWNTMTNLSTVDLTQYVAERRVLRNKFNELAKAINLKNDKSPCRPFGPIPKLLKPKPIKDQEEEKSDRDDASNASFELVNSPKSGVKRSSPVPDSYPGMKKKETDYIISILFRNG